MELSFQHCHSSRIPFLGLVHTIREGIRNSVIGGNRNSTSVIRHLSRPSSNKFPDPVNSYPFQGSGKEEETLARRFGGRSLREGELVRGFSRPALVDLFSSYSVYIRSHKDATNWRNRSFPHFDMLLTILGKDHATGKDVVTAEDVLEEASRNEESCDTGNLAIRYEEMKHFLSTNGNESDSKGRKRKQSDDSLDAFHDAATIIGSKIEVTTEKFNRVLGVDLFFFFDHYWC